MYLNKDTQNVSVFIIPIENKVKKKKWIWTFGDLL